MTTGQVLELGAGDWSTPVLHQLCKDRGLVTLELNEKWAARYSTLYVEGHKLVTEMSLGILDNRWSVVLVDNEADRRAQSIQQINAEIYVVHDTEPNHRMLYVGVEEALTKFRYRKDYDSVRPWTTLVSNLHPL